MMFAQADLSALPAGWLKYMIIFLVASAVASSIVVGAVVGVLQYLQSKRTQIREISPQPLTVEVVKALHEQFADREAFEDHTKHTTTRHAQIFGRIDSVERTGRAELIALENKIQLDRQRTMEKLNDQFSFIRESVASINTELKIRNEKR